MKYPTKAQLAEWLRTLKIDEVSERSCVAAMTAAIQRDRTGSARPDGYPTATLAGHAPTDLERLNSVESAAARRAEQTEHRDPIHENVEQFVRAMATAVEAKQRAFAHVHNLIDLMGIPKPPNCELLRSLVAQHEATNVGGRLPRPYNLSGPAFDFVRRHDRLPSTEEIHAYERYGAWKIRLTHRIGGPA